MNLLLELTANDLVVGANRDSGEVDIPDGEVCALNCSNGGRRAPLLVDGLYQHTTQNHAAHAEEEPYDSERYSSLILLLIFFLVPSPFYAWSPLFTGIFDAMNRGPISIILELILDDPNLIVVITGVLPYLEKIPQKESLHIIFSKIKKQQE